MLKGITIKLYEKVKTGVDEFNAPVYSYNEHYIDNVLVAPSTNDDIITSTDLIGKRAIYTIGIPKGDEHVWEDNIVEFFGHKWHVFTFTIQGIEDMIPLQWHKKVMVERYE